MDGVDLVQDRDSLQSRVNGVTNLEVPQNAENFLKTQDLLASPLSSVSQPSSG